MHVQPWHLPRRTWLIRHVGRCHGNGGKESAKEIFQGSGAQGKVKTFQETFINKKGAWKFLTPPFNREGQSTCCSVSVQRSIDRQWRKESEFEGELFNGGEQDVFENSNGFDVEAGDFVGGIESEIELGQQLDGLHVAGSAVNTGVEVHENEELDEFKAEGASAKVNVRQAQDVGEAGAGSADFLESEVAVENCRDVDGCMQVTTEASCVYDGPVDRSVDVGAIHMGENGASQSSNSLHPHAHTLPRDVLSPSGSVGGVGGVSVGSVGSSRWARGRGSARLSSPWCCPGCGLYGDGTLCMVCAEGEVCDQSRMNSDQNLRMERSHERRGGTKARKACTGIKVGSGFLNKPSGDASLADYLRSAPSSWPVEAWECRTVVFPEW